MCVRELESEIELYSGKWTIERQHNNLGFEKQQINSEFQRIVER